MEPGSKASVTFSYRGTIAADAESLQLRLNGETKGQESTLHPNIEFNDIPLPN
ncbi:hypothetical protein [Nitriliruptor alkaliphilus]|uniref:hypothetical protein n=1 Tax=Nitriliruptor alkaliphilus TaxID=427918 RepID=UPI0012ECC656|nr:hypothetical protein [Nitriliruptor alkaliphilus]